MEKWRGKVAIVTGASAGIGAAIAKDLVKHGVITIGLARRVNRVEELKADLGPFAKNLHSYQCDVSIEENVKEAFNWVHKNFGPVNILINNAGMATIRTILSKDDKSENMDQLRQCVNTNFLGVVYCTQEAFKQLNKSNDQGYIVNINSIAGQSFPFFGPGVPPPLNVYIGTKHAMTATSEVLRQELNYYQKNNIRITSISPGYVKSEFFVAAGKEMLPEGSNGLECQDVSDAVIYVLGTPSRVHIKEIIIKPNGELL